MSYKIWHMISNRWNSAITEYALSCANSLALLGHDNIYSPLSNTMGCKRAHDVGLNVIEFEDFSVRAISKIREIQKKYNPDFIFVYGGSETFLSKFLCKKKLKPKIIRFRGYAICQKDARFFNLLNKVAYSHVDCVLMPGDILKQNFQAFLPKKQMESVMLGVETRNFRFKNSWIKPKNPELLIFGRFDPVKGHLEFMDDFLEVLKNWPDKKSLPRLKIVGNPENISKEILDTKALKLGISNQVEVIGRRVSNPWDYMNAATIGVVCSLDSEVICRCAEEILCCGAPVFISGVGGLDEVLFEGAGISYKTLTPKERQDKLTSLLLEAREESALLRQKRSQKAISLFSYHKMGVSLDNLLKKLVSV